MRVVLVESNVKFLPQFDQHNMVDSTVVFVLGEIFILEGVFNFALAQTQHVTPLCSSHVKNFEKHRIGCQHPSGMAFVCQDWWPSCPCRRGDPSPSFS